LSANEPRAQLLQSQLERKGAETLIAHDRATVADTLKQFEFDAALI